MNKILVATGGRWYNNRTFAWEFLDEYQPTMVIHGGADGADSLVDEWARSKSIPRVIFGVEDGGLNGWNNVGRRAGPWRNERMIVFAKALREKDMFGEPFWIAGETQINGLALPGRDGTHDMCKRMRAAGLVFADYRKSSVAAQGTPYASDLLR